MKGEKERKRQLLREFVNRYKAPSDPFLDERGGVKAATVLVRKALIAKYQPLGLHVPSFETVKTWFYKAPPESVLALLLHDIKGKSHV
ncbi:MAG TPA: hypothetical protein V6D26_08630 [Stenomitos sp.]